MYGQTLTNQQKTDRSALQAAIREALEKGARNVDALGRVCKTIRCGAPPTAAQLRVVNATRSRLELPRVSVPVFDRERDRRRWEQRERKINSEHAALAASRPLAPPVKATVDDDE